MPLLALVESASGPEYQNERLKVMPLRSIQYIRKFWRKHLGVIPLERAIPQISGWFETPLGSALLSEERQSVDNALHCLFGYHFLQLSISPSLDLGQQSRISHRFALHPVLADNPRLSALADFHQLPLPEESLDVVLLHHTLDFSENPHQLLRESARLLIPRGHLIIVGFNPWSLFGAARWFARFFSRRAHWRHQSLRLGRLVDWLTLLDLDTVDIQQGFYRLPVQNPQLLKHMSGLERWGRKLRLPGGGYYIIQARKERAGMTPLKMAWTAPKPRTVPGLGVTKIIGRGRSRMFAPTRKVR